MRTSANSVSNFYFVLRTGKLRAATSQGERILPLTIRAGNFAHAVRHLHLPRQTGKRRATTARSERILPLTVRATNFAHPVRHLRFSRRTGKHPAAAVFVKGVDFRSGTAIQLARPARHLHLAVAGTERHFAARFLDGVPNRIRRAQNNRRTFAVFAIHGDRRRPKPVIIRGRLSVLNGENQKRRKRRQCQSLHFLHFSPDDSDGKRGLCHNPPCLSEPRNEIRIHCRLSCFDRVGVLWNLGIFYLYFSQKSTIF